MCTERKTTGLFVLTSFLCDNGLSLLLLAGNLSREHMIRITIVRHVGKVHFQSDYDILGHDKASFPKIGFI